jgi:hypothetical protein
MTWELIKQKAYRMKLPIINATQTRSGNPQRKNCAVLAFRISGVCVAEICTGLADCSGDRMRMEKRFSITVQSQTIQPIGVYVALRQFSLVEGPHFRQ